MLRCTVEPSGQDSRIGIEKGGASRNVGDGSDLNPVDKVGRGFDAENSGAAGERQLGLPRQGPGETGDVDEFAKTRAVGIGDRLDFDSRQRPIVNGNFIKTALEVTRAPA